MKTLNTVGHPSVWDISHPQTAKFRGFRREMNRRLKLVGWQALRDTPPFAAALVVVAVLYATWCVTK